MLNIDRSILTGLTGRGQVIKNKKAPWTGAFRGIWRSVLDRLKPFPGGEGGIRTLGTLRFA